eukprot:COSAG02_NODE_87_length_38906_cov_69.688697_13_plen_1572_part_00
MPASLNMQSAEGRAYAERSKSARAYARRERRYRARNASTRRAPALAAMEGDDAAAGLARSLSKRGGAQSTPPGLDSSNTVTSLSPRPARGLVRVKSRTATAERAEMLTMGEFEQLMESDDELMRRYKTLNDYARAASTLMDATSVRAAEREADAQGGASALLKNAANRVLDRHWAHLRELQAALVADHPQSGTVELTAKRLIEGLASGRREMADLEASLQQEAASSEDARLWEQARDDFRLAVESISEYTLAQYGRPRPFEIEYTLVRSEQDEADNMVTLEGGDITDKDGRSIWESRCYLTGLVLQNGGHGQGRMRYHSLSSEDADRSAPAHQLLCAIRSVVHNGLKQGIPGAQSAVDMLLTHDRKILDLVVPEHDHPVFQYIRCTSSTDTFRELIRSACSTFGPRPLFGVPRLHAHTLGTTGDQTLYEAVPGTSVLDIDMAGWEFVTYAHALQQAEYIGRGLLRTLHARVQHVLSAPPGSRVGILSENRPEWYYADMAAVLADRTTVGLHLSWSLDDIRQALEELEIGIIFVSAKYLKMCVDAVAMHTSDCVVVCFDAEEKSVDGHSTVGQVITQAALSEHKEMAQMHTQICTLAEVAQVGHAPISSLEAEFFEGHAATCTTQLDRRVYTMMLTSGSTGRSKAVVVLERRWIREIVSQPESGPCVQLSFTPASLMADRLGVYGLMMTGGQTGFIESSDLEAGLLSLRPTIFSAPPIYFNTLFSAYSDEIKATSDQQTRDQIEKRYRGALGGRCEIVGTGGAPISPAVLDWMRRIFNIGTDGALVGVNYGCTEVGNIATNGRLDERFRDGGPDKPCHFKLVSMPELGYLVSDLPYPRGEALVKTPDCIGAEYYHAADKTRAAWDADGYYHTGDVVELQPEGVLRIIGRCKDQLKLATGEFVSPTKIETIYDECDDILRIFVEASGLAPRVVAVIRPADSALARVGVINAGDCDQKIVEQFRDTIFQQMRATASMHNLRPAEVPSAIYLDLSPDDWSIDNLLLTPSEKPNRITLRDRYRDAIDMMLSAGATGAEATEPVSADVRNVENGSATDTSMEGRLHDLVVSVLGLDSSICRDELLSHSFAELGADSVKSMLFKTKIGGLNAVATSLSNSVTLHKPLRELATVLQGNITGSMLSTWKQAKLDSLSSQMDRDCVLPELQESTAEKYDATAATDVFLTGATGYVGAHFLAELLRLSSECGCQWKIRCLVRCKDAPAGLQRLRNVVTTQYLLSVDEACWSTRVQVVSGSMNEDHFGLDEPAWAELCSHVRTVVHLAAQVAFWDEYAEARVNVVGTVTVLRLCAASTPRKVLHHASTLSVFGDRGTQESRGIDESFPIGVNAAASGVLQSEGYSQSKWVCEKLVSRAALHCRWRIPVCIHRIGYVSFSTCSGVANSNGWFHKLLVGVAQAAAAPPVSVATPSVNLAPVDIVARAMVDLFFLQQHEIACTDSGSPTIYHLLNAAGCTPISVFFDALEGRGVQLRRCATHQEFFEIFSKLDDSNPLYSLAPWFEHGLPAESPFTAPHTMERLRNQCEYWRSDCTGWSLLGADVVDRHLQRLEDTQLVLTARRDR